MLAVYDVLLRGASGTTSAVAGSLSSTSPASHGRGSASAFGRRNLAVTANTYSHALADETEFVSAGLLGR